jgi:hypothetical protein
MDTFAENLEKPNSYVLLVQKTYQPSVVSLGIPFPRGKLSDSKQLTLIQGENSLSFYAEITGK